MGTGRRLLDRELAEHSHEGVWLAACPFADETDIPVAPWRKSQRQAYHVSPRREDLVGGEGLEPPTSSV
jgi:hypothetical protein